MQYYFFPSFIILLCHLPQCRGLYEEPHDADWVRHADPSPRAIKLQLSDSDDGIGGVADPLSTGALMVSVLTDTLLPYSAAINLLNICLIIILTHS